MSSAREGVYDEAYDPAKVSWQTDQLYRVEHARRMLKAARARAALDWAWHNRYEEEARQRAVALQVAQMERLAWRASPEGRAEEAARAADERERQHREDMVRRKYRIPAWAEWAAYRHAIGRRPHWEIGVELGNVAGSAVSRAVMDYVYLNHPDVTAEWHGSCPLDSGPRRIWLRRHFKGRSEPAAPRRVARIEEEAPSAPRTREEYRARNEWAYRQHLDGRTLQEIGDLLGLSRSRVDQICWTQAEIDWKRRKNWPKPKPWRAPANKGRPIDMGGPREVWLTYRSPADPRLDNMEPVRP